MIFLSGSFGQTEKDLIEEVFGHWTRGLPNGAVLHSPVETPPVTGRKDFKGPQSHQAAIRIGRRLFPQSHPDFNGLYFLNTLLGGYFGSRLMMEIRESKGLTYGIYSSVDSFAQDGCFYISTEAATANTNKVLKAIRKEADKLRQDLVPGAELQMAKNYLMGHMMTQIDGPFSTLEYIKSMKIEQIGDHIFADLVDTIQQITPHRLRELAGQYLNLDEWVTIVVK
jgi:predicted Zn-dependent peptidase